jgi:hypothetical protein
MVHELIKAGHPDAARKVRIEWQGGVLCNGMQGQQAAMALLLGPPWPFDAGM